MFQPNPSARLRSRLLPSALAAALLLSSSLPAAGVEERRFSDVPTTHWAAAPIDKMAERGVVQGLEDGSFAPESVVTYAEFLAMLTRAFYSDRVGPQKSPWYDTYVMAADAVDILSGTSAKITPEATITRYEMAQLIYNVIVQQGTAQSAGIGQLDIKDWAAVPVDYQQAVSACYDQGLLTGTEDGSFDGGSNMTRAQAATVMERLIGDQPLYDPEKFVALWQCFVDKTFQYTAPQDATVEDATLVLTKQVMDSLLPYDSARAFQLTGYEIVGIDGPQWNPDEQCWYAIPQVKIAYTGKYGAIGIQPADQDMVLVEDIDGWYTFGSVKITKSGNTYTLVQADGQP